MFTMKKFAVMTAVGFMASLMVACGDDPDEDCTDNPSLPECQQPSSSSGNGGEVWTLDDLTGAGWAAKYTVTLGDANATPGSFLDIDTLFKGGSNIPFTISTVGIVKDKIDLIYDGTNLFTPVGCAVSCPTKLKNAIAGSTSQSVFYTLPSNVTPATSASVIYNNVASYQQVNNVGVTAKGVYYLQTSANWYALILVGAKAPSGSGQTLQIFIGYDHD